jgi:hypothetical protein
MCSASRLCKKVAIRDCSFLVISVRPHHTLLPESREVPRLPGPNCIDRTSPMSSSRMLLACNGWNGSWRLIHRDKNAVLRVRETTGLWGFEAQLPVRQHHLQPGRRRIVTLLPDREPSTAQAWLAAHLRSRSLPVTVDMAKLPQRPSACGTGPRSLAPH